MLFLSGIWLWYVTYKWQICIGIFAILVLMAIATRIINKAKGREFSNVDDWNGSDSWNDSGNQ